MTMTLFEKIIIIYPDLTVNDFSPPFGTIILQNDSDGRGDYIKEWNHPVHSTPTDEQLSQVG